MKNATYKTRTKGLLNLSAKALKTFTNNIRKKSSQLTSSIDSKDTKSKARAQKQATSSKPLASSLKPPSYITPLSQGLESISSFQYSGAQARIKYDNRIDMSLIFSPYPCMAAGVFTTNRVRAACIAHNERLIASKQPIHAIIANAGNANACTSTQGERACKHTATIASQELHIDTNSILLASTGVIGVQLPLENISTGVRLLARHKASDRASAKAAAQGIMTTDTFIKEAAVEFITTSGKAVRIAGIAKGSGMIHPNMATMLCFLITDCAITQRLLQKALRKDVKNSFNMISVDGDTSTNDMVLLLANASAKNPPITHAKNPDFKRFKQALFTLTSTLAREVARDGEGATKLLSAYCYNAKKKRDARRIAKAVIASSLVKSAMFGNDANWGRILCAMGYSKGEFDPNCVDVWLESSYGAMMIMKEGVAQRIDERQASALLQQQEVRISIDCKSGTKSAQAFGCDLSYEYVRINADYRS